MASIGGVDRAGSRRRRHPAGGRGSHPLLPSGARGQPLSNTWSGLLSRSPRCGGRRSAVRRLALKRVRPRPRRGYARAWLKPRALRRCRTAPRWSRPRRRRRGTAAQTSPFHDGSTASGARERRFADSTTSADALPSRRPRSTTTSTRPRSPHRGPARDGDADSAGEPSARPRRRRRGGRRRRGRHAAATEAPPCNGERIGRRSERPASRRSTTRRPSSLGADQPVEPPSALGDRPARARPAPPPAARTATPTRLAVGAGMHESGRPAHLRGRGAVDATVEAIDASGPSRLRAGARAAARPEPESDSGEREHDREPAPFVCQGGAQWLAPERVGHQSAAVAAGSADAAATCAQPKRRPARRRSSQSPVEPADDDAGDALASPREPTGRGGGRRRRRRGGRGRRRVLGPVVGGGRADPRRTTCNRRSSPPTRTSRARSSRLRRGRRACLQPEERDLVNSADREETRVAVVVGPDRLPDASSATRCWSTTSTAGRWSTQPAIGAAFVDFGQGVTASAPRTCSRPTATTIGASTSC